MAKKFYWIKLKNSFLTSQKVDFLMSQPNGANYVVLYQILCLLTVNTNGELLSNIGEVIVPYDENKIAREAKWFTVDTIRCGLALYSKLGLIYTQENGVLKISDYEELVGSETKWAGYKREQRIGQSSGHLLDNSLDNVQQENKSIDIRDKNIRNNNNTCSNLVSFDTQNDTHLNSLDVSFESFWKAYPRKIGKQKCLNWFKTHKPSDDLIQSMISSIEQWKTTYDWKKENGRYIPYPYTW